MNLLMESNALNFYKILRAVCVLTLSKVMQTAICATHPAHIFRQYIK
jgi:hypothetical protein